MMKNENVLLDPDSEALWGGRQCQVLREQGSLEWSSYPHLPWQDEPEGADVLDVLLPYLHFYTFTSLLWNWIHHALHLSHCIMILNLHRAGHSPSSSCYIGDKNCCTDRPRRSHSQIFEKTKTVMFLILKYKFYCRQRMLHENYDDEIGDNSLLLFVF